MILRILSSFDFLKIHFENENFYFGNWNIISEILLKIKISFNIWSAHLRNWDFHFGNHFEKVYFGDGNLDFSSQKSHFENFSWKLQFDLKVQNAYFGNHNLVLGNQKFHFDSQKVISKFSFLPLDSCGVISEHNDTYISSSICINWLIFKKGTLIFSSALSGFANKSHNFTS